MHLGAVAEHFPPTCAEQGLQRLEAFQLQVMPVFAQAFQHGRGERGSELQPVNHPDVGRSLLH
ncbi:hypothetical protein D3C85_1034500 [compost metagenome]